MHTPENIPFIPREPKKKERVSACTNIISAIRKKVALIVAVGASMVISACATFDAPHAQRILESASHNLPVPRAPERKSTNTDDAAKNEPISTIPPLPSQEKIQETISLLHGYCNLLHSFVYSRSFKLGEDMWKDYLQQVSRIQNMQDNFQELYDAKQAIARHKERGDSRDMTHADNILEELDELSKRAAELIEALEPHRIWMEQHASVAIQTKTILDGVVTRSRSEYHLRNSMYRVFTERLRDKHSFIKYLLAWNLVMSRDLKDLLRNIPHIQLSSVTVISDTEINVHFTCPEKTHFHNGIMKIKRNPNPKGSILLGDIWGIAALKVYEKEDKGSKQFPPSSEDNDIIWD